ELAYDKVRAAMAVSVKQERYGALGAAHDELVAELCAEGKPYHGRDKEVDAAYEGVKKKHARATTLDTGLRIDGRRTTDIRPISCEVSVLPRTHGSGLFTRGEAPAILTTTLGTPDDM